MLWAAAVDYLVHGHIKFSKGGCALQAQQVGPQDAHDTSSFPQASGYPQQHLTPEQLMLAHSG